MNGSRTLPDCSRIDYLEQWLCDSCNSAKGTR